MVGRLIQTTKSAYQYPLIFKQLCHTPRVQAPDQEIVYRDLRRFTYRQIKERIGRLASATAAAAKVDLKGLKMVIGGSALPKALAKQALAAGIDIFAGYGMSETGPLAAGSHVRSKDLTGDPDGEVEFRTGAGMAGPLVDLRIVDSGMNDVPHDGKSAGEIVLRAPWLTQGYFDNPETSEQLWAGGYLHTSDIAVVSPDGYVHITDRIKDVIKTGGEWVSSLQIEDLISQCAGVAESAVIGVKDDKWGERPLALVVKQAPGTHEVE